MATSVTDVMVISYEMIVEDIILAGEWWAEIDMSAKHKVTFLF